MITSVRQSYVSSLRSLPSTRMLVVEANRCWRLAVGEGVGDAATVTVGTAASGVVETAGTVVVADVVSVIGVDVPGAAARNCGGSTAPPA